jgi:pimeloyl-ACP methyl ester carboxylesterase
VPFVTVNGTAVHYVEHGPGRDAAAHTAVLLHGFPLDHRVMTGCFEPVFAGRPGWRRVYLDLPGMGETVAPENIRGTDDVFAVVRAAVERLVPGGRFALCGESYGGYLALGLVAADPAAVTGLALVCPMVVTRRAARDLPAPVVLARERSIGERDSAAMAAFAVVHTEETLRRYRAEVRSGEETADAEALARIAANYAGTFPLEPGGGTYRGPALFVLGRQDSVTGYRDAWRILEHYPRATLAVLDRAGHVAQIEQPALFAALASEWLDRIEEQAQAQLA